MYSPKSTENLKFPPNCFVFTFTAVSDIHIKTMLLLNSQGKIFNNFNSDLFSEGDIDRIVKAQKDLPPNFIGYVKTMNRNQDTNTMLTYKESELVVFEEEEEDEELASIKKDNKDSIQWGSIFSQFFKEIGKKCFSRDGKLTFDAIKGAPVMEHIFRPSVSTLFKGRSADPPLVSSGAGSDCRDVVEEFTSVSQYSQYRKQKKLEKMVKNVKKEVENVKNTMVTKHDLEEFLAKMHGLLSFKFFLL